MLSANSQSNFSSKTQSQQLYQFKDLITNFVGLEKKKKQFRYLLRNILEIQREMRNNKEKGEGGGGKWKRTRKIKSIDRREQRDKRERLEIDTQKEDRNGRKWRQYS